MTATYYVGEELDIFANARNWKRYWASEIGAYVVGDVLEVGAGLGANTEFLKSSRATSWSCIEPDPELVARMGLSFASQPLLADCRIQQGTTAVLSSDSSFDAVLYIDVLEHISDDRAELARASRLLRPEGVILVLAPAHQWLYTAFDRSIGHFRRYDKAGLAAQTPADCRLVRLDYLDSAGLLASLGNLLLLRQAAPTLKQILFWDRVLVPISRCLDGWTFHTAGKSILAIWQKER